jgi:cytochrome b pre-mRNA-processing protein 3
MISFPFRRPRQDPRIAALYGTIVAQARLPAFYRDYGVPDTVSARIDMLMLHLVLVLRRRRSAAGGRPLSQQLFDHFCQDIDDNFREMGVGDLKVPKEMRRVAAAFYGRAHVYDAALDAGDEGALAEALGRNVFGASEPPMGAWPLGAYMRGAERHLAACEDAAVLRAELGFPGPEAMTARAPSGEQQA